MTSPQPPAQPSGSPGNGTSIPLSLLHRIEIAEELRHLLARPQESDFPIHTIARKSSPDGRDFVHSQLVIAGRKTRKAHPAAMDYPVHFLKEYSPWTLHGDPRIEYENSCRAAEILSAPAPIGFDANTFRAAFLPGRPLSRLSPFTNVDPPERCLSIAYEADSAGLIGLWKLAEEVYEQVVKLHEARFIHGDLELHNIVVCTAPVRAFLIDFESSEAAFAGDEEAFAARQFRDLEELFRLAIYLQSGLGRQESPLAYASLEALPRLFRSEETFVARLDAADRRSAGG